MNNKKITFLTTMLIVLSSFIMYKNKYHKKNDNLTDGIIIAAYIDGKFSDNLPSKDSGYDVDKIDCDNDIDINWDYNKWGFSLSKNMKRAKCTIYFKFKTEYNYDYTEEEQIFTAATTGVYKLETWGAAGGDSISNGVEQDTGGKGGYSVGNVILQQGDKLYINVGGKGADGLLHVNDSKAGYNGGGLSHWDKSDDEASGAGGGATHIAKVSGLLSTLENNNDDILIVAAGGGGGSWTNTAGSGGGFIGGNGNQEGLGATQTTGYKFGHGGDGANNTNSPGGGGGGGYYGGNVGTSDAIAGGGGSSYIGNSLLINKAMYCYNCTESSAVETKTVTTTCNEETPTENCSKKGNGYAKITFVTNMNIEFYGNNEKLEKLPERDFYDFDRIECAKGSNLTWDNDNWQFSINNAKESDTCKVYFKQVKFLYAYTGTEQIFTANQTGLYKLELWGSQGSSGNTKGSSLKAGGYGAYSTGILSLSEGNKLYVNVGGGGDIVITSNVSGKIYEGGYNGGGAGRKDGPGGGATHIAKKSGVLSNLENSKDDIVIVAGGGGGTSSDPSGTGYCLGGAGGGINGVNGTKIGSYYSVKAGNGGTQTTGYSFGLGESYNTSNTKSYAGGGGGYYGGTIGNSTSSFDACAGGGSGYIGSSLLSNKVMYCYNCKTSDEVDTKTETTTCSEEIPTDNCAKKGNGYARITFIKNN